MKKFRFNLESVLDYRQLKEDQERQKLADANRIAALAKEHLVELQQKLEREQEFIGQALNQPMSINLTEAFQSVLYLETLRHSVKEQEQRLQRAQEEVSRCQVRVLKAHQETQVIENIKKKKLEEYLAEMNKREQQLMDELGLSGFVRKAVE